MIASLSLRYESSLEAVSPPIFSVEIHTEERGGLLLLPWRPHDGAGPERDQEGSPGVSEVSMCSSVPSHCFLPWGAKGCLMFSLNAIVLINRAGRESWAVRPGPRERSQVWFLEMATAFLSYFWGLLETGGELVVTVRHSHLSRTTHLCSL